MWHSSSGISLKIVDMRKLNNILLVFSVSLKHAYVFYCDMKAVSFKYKTFNI